MKAYVTYHAKRRAADRIGVRDVEIYSMATAALNHGLGEEDREVRKRTWASKAKHPGCHFKVMNGVVFCFMNSTLITVYPWDLRTEKQGETA